MREKNISAFKSDIIANDGYIYMNTSRLSIARSTQAIYQIIGSVKGKKIIDIGCGDGVFTKELSMLEPECIVGIDPNDAAI